MSFTIEKLLFLSQLQTHAGNSAPLPPENPKSAPIGKLGGRNKRISARVGAPARSPLSGVEVSLEVQQDESSAACGAVPVTGSSTSTKKVRQSLTEGNRWLWFVGIPRCRSARQWQVSDMEQFVVIFI